MSRTAAGVPWPIAPMKANTARLPRGDLWVYEPKWDGHRTLVRMRGDAVQAVSSNGIDRTDRWPWLVAAVRDACDVDVILDGEVIALDDDGMHSFQLVGRPDRPHAFVIFDVLAYDGRNLLSTPWQERRDLLTEHIRVTPPLSLTPVSDDADALMEVTRARGFEGVIAKRVDSTYLPGKRTSSWVKVKHRREQEVVIGGYMLGEGNRTGRFGSLLVGVYEKKTLRFAGGVGTGFNERTLNEVQAELDERVTDVCPFDPAPKLPRGKYRWVRPELVAEVTFGEWTEAGHLRHPVYLGLRDDKDPRKVIREPG